MKIPCKIQALKHIKYGEKLVLSPGDFASVTFEHQQSYNRYRMLRVSCHHSFEIFTEKALENAVARGDFSLV